MEREDTVRKSRQDEENVTASRSHTGTPSPLSKHRLQRTDVSFDDSSSVFNSLITPYHETEHFSIFWLTFLV